MRRFILLISFVVLVLTGCKENLGGHLSVTPAILEFNGDAGTKTLTVTSGDTWVLKQSEGSTWCTTSSTFGKSSASIDVTVTANTPAERTAELVFSSSGQPSVTVVVKQAPGTADENPGSDVPGEFYPDRTSGITVEPALPDADLPCTIKFNPQSGNPLYGYTGELYGHLGVVVDGEWKYVPTDWGTEDEKTHFSKVAENSWELKIEPSIREYFQSEDTPVVKIAIIVRTADGSVKSHEADQFCSVTDSKYKYEEFIPDPIVTKRLPEGAESGINYNEDNSVTFVLCDKDKSGNRHDYCYIVGDWNNWERVPEGAMMYDGSAGVWWITLDGFDPDKEYRFQYRVGTAQGSELYLSDPYTEIVYDQWNDHYISSSTYPGLPSFPEKAKALVSAFKINRDQYDWQVPDFTIEDKDDLIIYEMLFRDFTLSKDINGALAELDYIEELGVNAVELMPIQEFDGNLSWGYNPNHYFALDKAYGTREMYKQFIDECHKRGIAVIVDVVYNHLTGISTFAKMYYSGDVTTESNPWFNVTAPHPFSVFHDINHENEQMEDHIKRSLEYLLEEYNIDGFRFDLTKGFTNKKSNESSASYYDADRVRILKGYNEHIRSVNPDAVVILEHFCELKEEKELVEDGMKVWRNVNYEYRSAQHGSAGNFSAMWTGSDGMHFGGYVGFMESHDEERTCFGATAGTGSVEWGICGTMTSWGAQSDISLNPDEPFFVAKDVTLSADDMFKIRGNSSWDNAYNYGAASKGYRLPLDKGYQLTLGASSQDMAAPQAGTYDIYFSPEARTIWVMTPGSRPEEPQVEESDEDPLAVAMRRAGCNAAFFLTVPGPKMIWQFGEIGYDISIEHNGRTGEKPVLTDKYMADEYRKGLYDTYAALLDFRRENPRFFDSDAKFEWTPSEQVKTIRCSVDGKTFYVVGNFTIYPVAATVPDGSWKDYFTGEDVSGSLELRQGEFRLLVDF